MNTFSGNLLKLWLFTGLLAWLYPTTVVGQDADYSDYQLAQKKLVLLINQNRLLPLKNLDTLEVGVFSLTGQNLSEMVQTMRKYTPHVRETEAPGQMGRKNAIAWAQTQAEQFDLLVMVLRDEASGSKPPDYMFRRAHVQELQKRAPLITVLLNPQDGLRRMQALSNSDALLVSSDTFWGHALAAQAIFGGSPVQNTLTNDLSDAFPAGSGLPVAASRLGYAPPRATGMDPKILADSIPAIVGLGLDSMAYPGAQVLVAHRGKVVYHDVFGHHTYDRQRPVRHEDLYDLASITKVTSALPALMRWYGQGTFDIDAPLTRYFDGFGRRSNKDELTYREMLAHHARLRPWIPYWQGTLRGHGRYPWRRRWDPQRINDHRFRRKTFARTPDEDYSVRITDSLWLHRDYREKIYKAIRKSPLNEDPGYVYSGLLFYLLPELVTDLSGTDFETYLKDNFYHPLGAFTITYNPLRYYPPERIVPTEQDTFFRMQLLHGTVHDEGAAMMGGISGNAGLFASANDLAKLFQMYMNYGYYGGLQLISAKAVQEFTRCQFCAEDNRRGLGFDKPMIEYDPESSYVAPSASAASFGHSGYTGTFVWADPEAELVVIFLSNRVYPTRLNRRLYELGIRPRLHEAIYQAIR